NNTPSIGSLSWGGLGNDPIDNSVKPEFIWNPSYSLNIDISPRVKTIKFGEGFSQDIPDSINSNLLNIECVFDGRDIEEATAILHFLSARSGTQTFLFTLPTPFNKKKRWKSQEYPASINFWNNNSIKCVMREVVV
ncbi:MAG: phage tail protein, partial [Nanoarchaeota archaeon]